MGFSNNRINDYAGLWGMDRRLLRGRRYRFVDFNDPFNHRPFLLYPLMVQPQCKGYKKSRQAGVSENSVTDALWMLDKFPANVVYTFPSPKQVEDFSNTRIKPALMESKNDSLRQIMGDPQNVTLRRVGKGYLYLRSATTERLGEGIDADAVFFDEIDRMRANVGVAFRESLSASKFGWVREISTPTLPSKGIDVLWGKSNQMLWHVKCEACGRHQTLEYPGNIKQLKEDPPFEKIVKPGTYDFCCRKCGSLKLNRWKGFWQPSYEGREDWACFAINQLMCVWISADEIMQKKKDYRFPQLFWNYVLGEVYAADNILLTERHLERCVDIAMINEVCRVPQYPRIAVGIDWGHLNYCSVYGTHEDGRTVLLGLLITEDNDEPLDSTKQIEAFIRPFRPDCIVADWGYGKDRTTYLAKQFPARVFGCTYMADAKTLSPRFSEATHTVNVDRTAWLKALSHAFREARVCLPPISRLPLLPTFVRHMVASVLMISEDDAGKFVERVDNIGDDHFFHASGYAFMGLEYMADATDFAFDFV